MTDPKPNEQNVFGGAVSPERDLFAIVRTMTSDGSGPDAMLVLIDTATWRTVREIGPYPVYRQNKYARLVTFSPDQRRIYFTLIGPHGQTALVSVRADGRGRPRRIRDDTRPLYEPLSCTR